MNDWTLVSAKEFMNNVDYEDMPQLVSLAWWLIRKVAELEHQNRIFYNNMSKSVQRRLDAQGPGLGDHYDTEKRKIEVEEGGDISEPGRPRRRLSQRRSRALGSGEHDDEL